MKHAVSQELLHYWDQLRGRAEAPERGDVDPAAIRGILADTFIIEITNRAGEAERDCPIRLAGTRLNALFLAELKGRSLRSLFASDHRAALDEMITSAIGDGTATVAGVTAAPFEGAEIDLEMLLLPLRHHGQAGQRMLGSLAPFRIPSWLGLRAVLGMTVTSMRTVASPAVAISRAPPPHSVCRSQPVRRGRFTVHEGGRQGPASVLRPRARF